MCLDTLKKKKRKKRNTSFDCLCLSDIYEILRTNLSAFKLVALLTSGSYTPGSVSPLLHNAPPADTKHHKHTPQRLRSRALSFSANTVPFSLCSYHHPRPIKEIASLGKPVVCQMSEDCPGIPTTPCPFCEFNVNPLAHPQATIVTLGGTFISVQ